MPTDAYRAWLAAHPDLDALDDREKDREAALARGWLLADHWPPGAGEWCPDGIDHGPPYGEDPYIEELDWSPTLYAAQAVKFAQATADQTGWRVRISIDSLGSSAHAPVGNMPAMLDVPDCTHSAETFPAALTTACLAARRAMMERDA